MYCFLLATRWLSARLRLHEGKVIKDRRHHLRTYPNCFVAKELIDWLIEHKEAMDRDTAIKIMQKLLDQSIVHHGEPVSRQLTLSLTPDAVAAVIAVAMVSLLRVGSSRR